jgi:hypothetical protein
MSDAGAVREETSDLRSELARPEQREAWRSA